MTLANHALLPAMAALLAAAPALAAPVFVAETPGRTKFLIDDATVEDIVISGTKVRQARILTRSAPDPQMTSGQVAADGIMQFNCDARTYRQWSTTSIRKDGTRAELIRPLATRRFNPTRDGSFERKLLIAACAMRKTK